MAGAANNQLATPADAEHLLERGILYAPDYVINAGGIIDVYNGLADSAPGDSRRKVLEIGATLGEIFRKADSLRRSPADIADYVARSRVAEVTALAS